MQEHITRYALFCFERQHLLAEQIEGHDWAYDLRVGMLSFGDKFRWKTQLLGTVSDTSNTWLWAWANTSSNIPEHLLTASRFLKAYGEQHNLAELTEPEFPPDQIDGHTLALLASGLCDANAYYRCPFDGGALFVLITDENFPACTDPPLQRIASVLPQAIGSLDIPDHRLALIGYLDHNGLHREQDDDKIVVKENGEVVLTAAFDKQGRLTNLVVKLKADVPGATESWEEE